MGNFKFLKIIRRPPPFVSLCWLQKNISNCNFWLLLHESKSESCGFQMEPIDLSNWFRRDILVSEPHQGQYFLVAILDEGSTVTNLYLLSRSRINIFPDRIECQQFKSCVSTLILLDQIHFCLGFTCTWNESVFMQRMNWTFWQTSGWKKFFFKSQVESA